MTHIGWSFCIVNVPGNERVLYNSLENLFSEIGNSPCEVIVVGSTCLNTRYYKDVKFIHFDEEVFQPNLKRKSILKALRAKSIYPLLFREGAICHKKNLAAKIAKFNKLCIMHDYISIMPGWLSGYKSFGEDWDVAMNVIFNSDGSRHRDWLSWDHPFLTKKKNGEGACLLPYDLYTKYMYMPGQYFCVKRKFFLMNKLDEKLFWGEGEDVEWSFRVREKTRFRMNTSSAVKYLKFKSGAPDDQSWKRN